MKRVMLVIIIELSAILLFAEPYIEAGQGIGKYKYLEYDAVTYFSLNTNTYDNVWTLGARTWCGSEYIYWAPDKGSVQGSNVTFITGDYNSANSSGWDPGAMYYVSVYAQYGDNGSSGWSHSSVNTGFSEISLRIVDIATSTSGISTSIVDNPSGSQNLVMNFKIDSGSGASELLKKLWVQNNGTAQEGDDIPNDGIKLYYEDVTGSESFDGDESWETLLGNDSDDSGDNELWGKDALKSGNGINIPDDGLRCYIVVSDLASGFNSTNTTNFAIVNDGINLKNGLMRIDETPSGSNPATLPVELSTFTVMLGENGPLLNWTTQSEENNAGWNVYRGETEAAWQQQNVVQLNSALGLIEGAGTTSQPTEYEFEDIMPTQPDNSYWYWLESVDYSGVTELYGPVMVEIPAHDPGFIEAPEVPPAYGLQQNYPNPFNPSTEISFTLQKGGPVQLSVYNLKGQLLQTLIDGETMSGNQQHSVVWDGKDRYGNEVTSGIYLYKLRTLEKVYTKKMLLMK